MKVIYKISEVLCKVLPFEAGRVAIILNAVFWFIVGDVPFVIAAQFVSGYKELFLNIGLSMGALVALIYGVFWGFVVLLNEK